MARRRRHPGCPRSLFDVGCERIQALRDKDPKLNEGATIVMSKLGINMDDASMYRR